MRSHQPMLIYYSNRAYCAAWRQAMRTIIVIAVPIIGVIQLQVKRASQTFVLSVKRRIGVSTCFCAVSTVAPFLKASRYVTRSVLLIMARGMQWEERRSSAHLTNSFHCVPIV